MATKTAYSSILSLACLAFLLYIPPAYAGEAYSLSFPTQISLDAPAGYTVYSIVDPNAYFQIQGIIGEHTFKGPCTAFTGVAPDDYSGTITVTGITPATYPTNVFYLHRFASIGACETDDFLSPLFQLYNADDYPSTNFSITIGDVGFFTPILINSSTVMTPFPVENQWAATSVTDYVNAPTSTDLSGLDYVRNQCDVNFLTQIACWVFMPSVSSTDQFLSQRTVLNSKFPFSIFYTASSTLSSIDTTAAASSSPVGFTLGNQYYATHTIIYYTPSVVATQGEPVFSVIRTVMGSLIGFAWIFYYFNRVRHLQL